MEVAQDYTFTGTTSTGQAANNNCINWISPASSGDTGRYGRLDSSEKLDII
jgi:hypothetical protein